MNYLKKIFLPFLLILSVESLLAHDLEKAIGSPDRTPAYAARDNYRNPLETLQFFGIEQDMTVVELNPGGGWYTEILANYIHYPGTLIAASGSYYTEKFNKKMDSNPMYGRVELVDLKSSLADPDSVDAIVTFRNLHNWLGEPMDAIFKASYKALKKGGSFGVVEHRAKPGTSLEDMKSSGYVTEKLAIETAKRIGFELIAKSEINANSKDTKDYEKGVWTLPPRYRLGEKDKQKYSNIGESDRMTLLFRKP